MGVNCGQTGVKIRTLDAVTGAAHAPRVAPAPAPAPSGLYATVGFDAVRRARICALKWCKWSCKCMKGACVCEGRARTCARERPADASAACKAVVGETSRGVGGGARAGAWV